MSEPTRLKDLPGLESDLLRSAHGDAMPDKSRRALALTLGLGPAAPAPIGAAAGTKAVPAIAAKTGLGVAAKVMIAVTVAGGIGAGGYLVVHPTAESPGVISYTTTGGPIPQPDPVRPVPSIAPATPAPPPETPPTPPAELAPPPLRAAKATTPPPAPPPVEVVAVPPPEAPIDRDPVPQLGSGSTAPPVVRRSVTDEITLIDAARAALRHHDAARALAVLDDYDRQFPAGTMLPEAAVARIEATVATGDQARAHALEAAFLAAHPDSPLAQRVRALMADNPVAP